MNLQQLLSAVRDQKCSSVYAKRLAENDNSKNQVYFGSDFETLNIFPNLEINAAYSGSHNEPIFKAKLNFKWIDESGALWNAPAAQIIYYPQYPEVRFSGFLKGCKHAPSDLMTIREAGRWLVLGIRENGEVLGFVVGSKHSMSKELDRECIDESLFHNLATRLNSENAANNKTSLLRKLKGISEKNWITSKRMLPNGTLGPCNAPNCGGYTLEAELGILPNGFSEPDYLGWEIKQYRVPGFERVLSGRITLMTPEPTGGYYADHGALEFLKKYGYPDATEPGRLNFSSPHYATKSNNKTNLVLKLDGYDSAKSKITNSFGGLVLLDHEERIVSRWDFDGLMKHWNRKHALAAFIPACGHKTPVLQYRYGHLIRLGIGTDFLFFLNAINKGIVYYDPGINAKQRNGKMHVHRRNQFRISSGKISVLYKKVESVDLSAIN
ncbi:MAG: MvaI/BcnI family restriction endonuclease [Kiritimatiellae bacterium]|nr:MvaI/BcnI family restriction endonuclease [Kiritimatiellia bacterium]